ncbi:saccharopine dehydrogenase NADP-binding domain-containing protein [Streptomyces sp. ALI-76-A]|nr:saccharopine dehydrogenase NADP-binding domain-containing protein [Streptomyces sp. ALI-76-A]MDL5205790.1 saccharopine dehydrogenase NADP-binding domain-containing protein [Streptomyces sp. ALI-76-A]
MDAVVDCATPFTSYREPVVRAAIDAGAHYVDVSGEALLIKGIRDGPRCRTRPSPAGVIMGT